MRKSTLKINIENRERGYREEEIFQKCVEKFRGVKCVKSSKKEDIYKHIDFYIGDNISVDVKAHKKINAKDIKVSYKFTWVEILNSRGFVGWLGGEATHIAYSFTTHYKLFNREELKKYIFSVVDLQNVKNKNGSSRKVVPYQVYRRGTLKDRIVLVPIEDLIKNVSFLRLKRDEKLLK